MFHIFYVNDGYLLGLDIPPIGYFRDLNQELTQKTGVEPRDQIFFLSSGEALLGDYSLSSYPDVGTESNPIYCIKRTSNEKDPINSREKEGIENIFENWKRDVEKLHALPVKISLVSSYSDECTHGLEVAETLIRYCAKIVTEHQYLNFGWTAVARNLDENVKNLSSRYGKVYRIAQRLPQIRKTTQNWVANYENVLNVLSRIKIPGSLLMTSQSVSSDLDSQADSPPESITLLDWIEKQDPLHTIDVLFEHVSQHIEMLDDNDVRQAGDALKGVSDLIKRNDYREIKGIDKRLGMLDAKLVELERAFVQLKDSAQKLIHMQADQNNFRAVVSEQREKINNLSMSLNEFTKHAFLFLNSKMELLTNVRKRLAGWIRQSYDRLQSAQTNILIFEEKFGSFRKRLDLVRQIREAPLLFVASVAEVIRRSAFKEEFNEWMIIFIEKCSEFIKEENTIRAEFYCKLEKHFLHDIFKGMGDELPNFCPSKIKFDGKLPIVSDDLLRELRESLKDCPTMDNYFTIVYPQVFNRLMVTPKTTQPPDPQPYFLRRESFFVSNKASNPIPTFPSSHWLSGVNDEHSEMSPTTNQFFLSKTASSTTSLSSNLTTPSDLVSNLESIHPVNSIPAAMCSPSSEPSSIDLASPTSLHPDRFHVTNNKADSETSTRRPVFQAGDDSEIVLNLNSTETSVSATPSLSPKRIEESQQTMLQESSITIKDSEIFNGIKPRLLEIMKELGDLKFDAVDQQTQMKELIQQTFNSVLDKASQKLKESQKALEEQIQANTELKEENAKLKEVIEHERYLRVDKEKEVFTLNENIKKLNDDLLNTIQDKNQLQIELLSSEADRKKLEERIETESNGADCLSIELDIVSQVLKRELQPDEVEWIRSEIEKRKIVKKTDSEASSHHEPSSRAEYENVLRKKMTLIVQGMEERKNEEIAKLRDIIENETKEENSRFVRKLKQRISELEDKLHFYENVGPSAPIPTSPIPTINPNMITSFTTMNESCQVIKEEEDDKPTEQQQHVEIVEQGKEVDDEDEDLAIVTVSKHSIGTQTKLKMRDLRMMVSLTDISEGWAVILLYSEQHSSYAVFSMNNLLYFVKQRSLHSLGIENNTAPSKNKLIFARISGIELCETKKAPNRYNLPANTRFYRVDVSPMPLTGLGLPASVTNVDMSIEAGSTKTV